MQTYESVSENHDAKHAWASSVSIEEVATKENSPSTGLAYEIHQFGWLHVNADLTNRCVYVTIEFS